MENAKRILLIIAIIICLVQIAVLINDITKPPQKHGSSKYIVRESKEILNRTKVYWGSGIVFLSIAVFLLKKFKMLQFSFGTAGCYLMLLGSNGGLLSKMMIAQLRLFLSVLTLIILVILSFYIFHNIKKDNVP